MVKAKRSSAAASSVVLLLAFASLKDVVSGIRVDISPRSPPVVREGQNFTFKCNVGKQLQYCRIKIPGRDGLNLKDTSRKPDYWYEGEGLNSGQCGITLARIENKNNGKFECTMGTMVDDAEIYGSLNVTVAKPPLGQPDLAIEPMPVRGIYREDTVIRARCTVRDARPVAILTWFIGNDQIYDGTGQSEIVESPGNLYTVSQNLTRKLTWRDSGKDLRCVASHVALDSAVRQTIQQIEVAFKPRPKSTIEKFGLVVGEESIVTVHIEANPQPYVTWFVGQESIPQDNQDRSQRFTVSRTRSLGNNTWETSLTISAISPEDVNKRYSLKARNDFGEETYRVQISTGEQPKEIPMELGTGPIIGIVVAILLLLFIVFMLIFARATGRWCFSANMPSHHDNKESETFLKDSQTPNKGDDPMDEKMSLSASTKEHESSDTESADHGPSQKYKKPKMNLTYILKKKKDKVAADDDDLKLQSVAMEPEKEIEKPGTESSEHIATPVKVRQGQDVVYAELDLQATRRPVVRREDEKTEYAEIIHTNPSKEEDGAV